MSSQCSKSYISNECVVHSLLMLIVPYPGLGWGWETLISRYQTADINQKPYAPSFSPMCKYSAFSIHVLVVLNEIGSSKTYRRGAYCYTLGFAKIILDGVFYCAFNGETTASYFKGAIKFDNVRTSEMFWSHPYEIRLRQRRLHIRSWWTQAVARDLGASDPFASEENSKSHYSPEDTIVWFGSLKEDEISVSLLA